MNVLAAIALIVGGFILGVWAASRIQSYLYRALRKNGMHFTIEDRAEGACAMVMLVPAEHRELAEKIVKKMREEKR